MSIDTDVNRTRDLEGVMLRKVLAELFFKDWPEIGCGTGKNTLWLADHAIQFTSVALSEEMLKKAKEKDTCKC